MEQKNNHITNTNQYKVNTKHSDIWLGSMDFEQSQ